MRRYRAAVLKKTKMFSCFTLVWIAMWLRRGMVGALGAYAVDYREAVQVMCMRLLCPIKGVARPAVRR